MSYYTYSSYFTAPEPLSQTSPITTSGLFHGSSPASRGRQVTTNSPCYLKLQQNLDGHPDLPESGCGYSAALEALCPVAIGVLYLDREAPFICLALSTCYPKDVSGELPEWMYHNSRSDDWWDKKVSLFLEPLMFIF